MATSLSPALLTVVPLAPLVGAVLVGSQISSSAAGRVSGNLLVTVSLLFCASAALVNVTAATALGPVLPWVVLGPALRDAPNCRLALARVDADDSQLLLLED